MIAGTFIERHNDGFREESYSMMYQMGKQQRTVLFRIYDTCGKEPFKSLSWTYYRNCAAILLVFDLTLRESFDNLRMQFEELQQYAKECKHLILIGNKHDIKNNLMSYEEGEQFAHTHNMIYYQTSGKEAPKDIKQTGLEEILRPIGLNMLNYLEDNKGDSKIIGLKPGPYYQDMYLKSTQKKRREDRGCC